jgi:nucleotide-binding universal stress UspA family protein
MNERISKAVLGLSGGPTDDLVIDLGCEFAVSHHAEVVAIHVVEVDWRHDLDDELDDTRDSASRVLDLAEGVAERVKVRMDAQLIQARDVGAALVDEAVALEADAIILGLPYRKRFGGDFDMGHTIPYVFKNAPCGVFVVREPVAMSEARDEANKRT